LHQSFLEKRIFKRFFPHKNSFKTLFCLLNRKLYKKIHLSNALHHQQFTPSNEILCNYIVSSAGVGENTSFELLLKSYYEFPALIEIYVLANKQIMKALG
jgi:hypothetical protein